MLYDADTGEELARSVGTMDYIVPDQYTTLGLDPAVTGQEGRRYRLTVTPTRPTRFWPLATATALAGKTDVGG